MNTLSTKTLGHLIHLAETMRKSSIRDLLMQSGLYDATGMDTAGLLDRGTAGPNKSETLRKPLLNAHDMSLQGNREAHDALLAAVRLVAERTADWHSRDAEARLFPLRETLLSDGYDLRVINTNPLADFTTYEIDLLPVDPDAIPLSEEITALEAELENRAYSEAREHYREAVKHFTDQEHASSNGALRKMIESLVKHLAIDHTGYVDNGKANQGGAAIKTLYVENGKPPVVQGQPLPEIDGGRMLHGIWQFLHPGAHPGLSDSDEARIRMQLCTALARFLLKHFPAKP